jgi:hypothetical protein
MKYLSSVPYNNNYFDNVKQYNTLSKEDKNKWIHCIYNFYNKKIPLFVYSKPDILEMYNNLKNNQSFFVYSTFKNMNELKKHNFNSLIKFINDRPIIEQSYINKITKGNNVKFMNNFLTIVDYNFSDNFIKINHISDMYILKIRLECTVFNNIKPNKVYKHNYHKLINNYFSTLNYKSEHSLFIKKLDFKNYSNENLDNSINPIVFLDILRKKAKYCTLFKPYIFKNIVEIFKTVDCPNILDLSSGWGCRLLGAISIQNNIKSYVGIDPNSELHPCYNKMINDLCDEKNKYKFKMIDNGSEKVNYQSLGIKFNIVFWSPPFYKQEHYVAHENKENFDKQSIEMYKTYEEWEDKFFIKTLNNCSKSVDHHGVIILYLGNINYESFYKKMEKVMKDNQLSYLGNFSILGTTMRYFIVYYKI